MEKRINQRIQQYVSQFKEAVRTKAVDLDFDNSSTINELLEFVYEYDRRQTQTNPKRHPGAQPV